MAFSPACSYPRTEYLRTLIFIIIHHNLSYVWIASSVWIDVRDIESLWTRDANGGRGLDGFLARPQGFPKVHVFFFLILFIPRLAGTARAGCTVRLVGLFEAFRCERCRRDTGQMYGQLCC